MSSYRPAQRARKEETHSYEKNLRARLPVGDITVSYSNVRGHEYVNVCLWGKKDKFKRQRFEQMVFVDGEVTERYVGYHQKDTRKRGYGREGYVKARAVKRCSHLDFYNRKFSGILGKMIEHCIYGRNMDNEKENTKETKHRDLMAVIGRAEAEIRMADIRKKVVEAEAEKRRMKEEAEDNKNGEK